jgi:TonB-dependent receptor
VSINRDAGEGRNISVRGLGPLFTRVRINGMEGLSTTGGADATGGANRGRQFDFNTFASELFNSITVRKTASADVEEGSLGATVDLQTARPFDFDDDLTLVGSAAVGFNDFSESFDPKLTGLVSTKFADDTVGVLLSVAYSERGIFEEGPSTVRWERGIDNGGFAAASTLPSGATNFQFFHPRIPRYDSYRYETERLGVTGSIQWQPSDATLLTLDALYSDFQSNRAEQYLEAISFSRSGTGKPQTVILPGAVVDCDQQPRLGQLQQRRCARRIALRRARDRVPAVHRDVPPGSRRPRAVRRARGLFEVRLLEPDPDHDRARCAQRARATPSTSARAAIPTLGYGSLNVQNPGAFVLGEIRLRPQYVQNDFIVARGNFEYDVFEDMSLSAGIDYKEYGFDSQEYRRASETQVPTLAAGAARRLSYIYSITPETNTAGTPKSFVVPDIDLFDDAFGIYSNSGIYTLTGTTNTSAQGNWRTVEEHDLGGYLQMSWNIDYGTWRFRGDAGVPLRRHRPVLVGLHRRRAGDRGHRRERLRQLAAVDEPQRRDRRLHHPRGGRQGRGAAEHRHAQSDRRVQHLGRQPHLQHRQSLRRSDRVDGLRPLGRMVLRARKRDRARAVLQGHLDLRRQHRAADPVQPARPADLDHHRPQRGAADPADRPRDGDPADQQRRRQPQGLRASACRRRSRSCPARCRTSALSPTTPTWTRTSNIRCRRRRARRWWSSR